MNPVNTAPSILTSRRGRLAAASVLFALATAAIAAEESASGISFNRDIRPILSDRCFHCHGPDAGHRKAGLRLDTLEGATAAGRGGRRAVVPGDAAASALVSRIGAADPDERMPPVESGKELSPAEIALLSRWIAAGAPFEGHWAYQPLKRSPRADDGTDGAAAAAAPDPIDAAVRAKLAAAGFAPSPPADPVTLVRRLSIDLTGLPARPQDVEAFARDPSPAAYEALVDRLLVSPHYGERLALWWLDLVRYADTVGYHGDQEHPISPYRDWVIHAFNTDMPFDRFTTEQLAGDLLAEPTIDQRIASGYNRLLQTTHEGGAQDGEYLAKYAADRVRNVSAVWLGGTLGCAECHDHKYDPYTQRDFYSLAAFFADLQEQGAYSSPNTSPTTRPPELQVLSPIDRAELEAIQARLDALGAVTAAESEAAAAEIAALEARRKALASAKRRTMVSVAAKPRVVRILSRGDWMDASGEIVEPAVPRFLPGMESMDRRATRLDLARWITSPGNPLTARVLVNRLWTLAFGAGLSRQLDDMGSQGEAPSHPELLDDLCLDLIEGGWRLKPFIKRLVMTETYRQASLPRPELAERDPENRLLGRQSRQRVPAEMVRDIALAVSGLLVDRIGGPSARPYQPAGYYAHLNFPEREYVADKGAQQYRRGLYMHWQRQFLHPMLRAFDAPTREECTATRPASNTPLAALVLLNDPSFVEAARAFATRIVLEGGATTAARLRWAWRQALCREPSPRETAALEGLLEAEIDAYRRDPEAARRLLAVGLAKPPASIDAAELAAWTAVARAIFNASELITRS